MTEVAFHIQSTRAHVVSAKGSEAPLVWEEEGYDGTLVGIVITRDDGALTEYWCDGEGRVCAESAEDYDLILEAASTAGVMMPDEHLVLMYGGD